jgi:hypothetical protein
MTPTRALVERMFQLIADDSVTLGVSPHAQVNLISSAFVPSPALTPAGLTRPTTGGLQPILSATGTDVSSDPQNGDLIIHMNPPIGGWRWETSDTVGLNVTIFGFMLSDDSFTVNLGAQLLDQSIVFTGIGQEMVIPKVEFRINPAVIR